MGKLEKGFRPLNETELDDIQGGRADGQEQTCAHCQVVGCGWSSGWKNNQADVEQAMEAHKNETGHDNFLVEACCGGYTGLW